MTPESAHHTRPLALGRLKLVSLGIAVLVFAATWIRPRWPVEQGLQSSLTVIALMWLVWHARRWRMRDGEFAAVCIFIALHSIAARWLYSYVPYDAWCQRWLGWSPQLAFGWKRNHFDRLIHLAYGLCFLPAIHTWLRERWPLNKGQAFVIAVMAVMCSSLIYEWGEWAVALTLSPEQAEAYNGQLGDIWDAHMDMLLATMGGLLAWPLLSRAESSTRFEVV
jgi:putative membrane protein